MFKNAQEIGKIIGEKRREKGLTQAELAERVFVSAQAVSKWERGEALPDVDRFKELAQVLDIKVSEFIELSREDMPEGELPGDKRYCALENKADLTEVLLLAPEMSSQMLKKAYAVLRRAHSLNALSMLFAYMPPKMAEELAAEELRINGATHFAILQPYIGSELSDRLLLDEYTRYGIQAVLPYLSGAQSGRAVSMIFRHYTDTAHNWIAFRNHLSAVPQDVLVSQAIKITRELNAGLDPWRGWWVCLGSSNSVKFLLAYLDMQQDDPAAWGQVAQYYREMPLDHYAKRLIEQRALRVQAEKGIEAVLSMVPLLSDWCLKKLCAALDPERDGITEQEIEDLRGTSGGTQRDGCVKNPEGYIEDLEGQLEDLRGMYYDLLAEMHDEEDE